MLSAEKAQGPTITLNVPPIIGPHVPALIVINMQHDFVHGALQVPGTNSIIEPINNLLDLPFAIRIATTESHRANHTVTPTTSNSTDHIATASDPSSVALVPELYTQRIDRILYKGTHLHLSSYSAFRDLWSTGPSDLPALLNARGVTDV